MVGAPSGGAKSCKMDRMTRVMILQHRVSRIRRACVQKSMMGSKMAGEDKIKLRIESEAAGGPCKQAGSVDSAPSRYFHNMAAVSK